MSTPLQEPTGHYVGGSTSAPTLDGIRIELLRDVLRRFGRARLRVTGTSMLPTLWPGDVVVVQRVPASELRAGEIVLLQREQRLLCHRLVASVQLDGQSFLLTRGDFLAANDPVAPVRNLLGRIEMPPSEAPLSWLAPLLRAVAHISQCPIGWWVHRRARARRRIVCG